MQSWLGKLNIKPNILTADDKILKKNKTFANMTLISFFT